MDSLSTFPFSFCYYHGSGQVGSDEEHTWAQIWESSGVFCWNKDLRVIHRIRYRYGLSKI